jgi:hypothetical protein
MKNLTLAGVVLLVLGVVVFVVPIPHREDHGVKIGDTKSAFRPRVAKNYHPP